MVELQILNKVLKDKSDTILYDNNITRDYFHDYLEEYDWIMEHKQNFGNIPDIETFLHTFPEFEIITVAESDDYLIKTFREEYLYQQTIPVFTKLSELMQTNTYDAIDFLKQKLPELKIVEEVLGVDIISQADIRLVEWQTTKDNKDTYFIPTGFEELDEAIGGLHCGEELVVLFARTGQGKSWVAIKILEHAWKMNKRVGLLEPEMSATKTGYRFDTLHQHISNTALVRGQDIEGYDRYIKRLSSSDVPFFVTHPRDFNKKVTVSKLRRWCETNKLDILCIDGITYLQDERKQRGDNKTTALTNISEDLMQLSIDLSIPIIVVVQSNREGGKQEDLGLENIRDSDGIAYNASIVLSIQQKETGLQIATNKVRNGSANHKLIYMWEADTGNFTYIPNPEKGEQEESKTDDMRRQYNDTQEEY